uniref:Aromatic-L-amino-acid decarboxylase n=1 Tax=Timema genevievae TaxID=629358 RepID=A0A7R9K738_TIMGE|nr:unnamed protein product [Timema genevievae]
METPQFKDFAKDMVDYIGGYLDNIRDRRVLPTVQPGYLRPLLPECAPDTPDKWQDVMSDIERVIMPGVTHWHSPKFFAYFPTANSYPAIVADMLSGAIACIGFSWIASPACTELEVIMLDWLGKMLDLPKTFLACSGGKGGGVIQVSVLGAREAESYRSVFWLVLGQGRWRHSGQYTGGKGGRVIQVSVLACSGGKGGGVIQGTASEATLVALLGAKARALRRAKQEHPEWTDMDIVSRLVGYGSDQAHSSVERAGLLGGVKLRSLPTDDKFRLRGDTLEQAIMEDRRCGTHPLLRCGDAGNYLLLLFRRPGRAGTDLQPGGRLAACAAFICPEYRYLMAGVDKADSFNFNPHKWMLVNFDCSAMWLKDPMDVVNSFNVDPLYLKHDHQGDAPDYRHWQIPLGRRFRALKLWFVLRLYGVEGLQKHIRGQIALAHEFEDLVGEDDRFEIITEVVLGLVCFRLKGSNERNESLLKKINGHGTIHLVPSKVRDTYFLRLAVCSRFTESEDIRLAWREIRTLAEDVLGEGEPGK